MKKEEAIVIIDSLNPGVIIKTSASDEKIKEAIGMAVKALQEEPVSNDLEEVAQKAYPKDIHKQSIFIHGATYAYTHFKNTQLLDEGLEEAATKYAQDKYLPVQTAQSFKAGAKWQKEQMIDKACEWLEENKDHPFIGCEDSCLSDYLTDEFIEEFKKTMEK